MLWGGKGPGRMLIALMVCGFLVLGVGWGWHGRRGRVRVRWGKRGEEGEKREEEEEDGLLEGSRSEYLGESRAALRLRREAPSALQRLPTHLYHHHYKLFSLHLPLPQTLAPCNNLSENFC